MDSMTYYQWQVKQLGMTREDELELARAILKGDDNAYWEMWQLYRQALIRFLLARKTCTCWGDVEDIISDSLLRAKRLITKFKHSRYGTRPLFSWLCNIVRNIELEHWNQRHRCLFGPRKRKPETRKREFARRKERYHTDPEYRARVLANKRRHRERLKAAGKQRAGEESPFLTVGQAEMFQHLDKVRELKK